MAEERKAIRLEDGTKAEKVTREEPAEDGVKIVTEIWAEPVIEKKLAKRVSEYRKPMVYRRETETIDQTSGSVLDKTIESLEPEVNMQVRDHIVSSQSVESEPEDCYVTREDLKEMFASVIETIKAESVAKPSLSAQSILAEKAESSTQSGPLSTKGLLLLMFIAAEMAVLGYICFWM